MATYGGVRFLNFFNLASKKWTFGHHKYFQNSENLKSEESGTPISGHSLPTTEPVFNFVHYLVWFGNYRKLKNGFSP